MNVLLLQLDGKLPNLALMAIARHHREAGDCVELRQVRRVSSVALGLYEQEPDRVYASAIFERSRPIAREVLRVFPSAIVGGTGWDHRTNLEEFGIDATKHDYSDYPACRVSMGFTQRGCRFDCSFCKVPEAEGKVRPVATIADIWRGEPHARELLLLDNDFFGQKEWPRRIEELRAGRFKVSFNQGINARVLSDEAAAAIASVDYRDDGMKNRWLYTAWDSKGDEAVLFRGLERLTKHGIRPDNIIVYTLIGYWADDTEADWLHRQRRLREFGARPYPMPYNRRDPLQMGFQRWCVRRADLKVPWSDYKAAKCRPEKLKHKARPLFQVGVTGGDD
jgi:hypothetical protein